MTTNESENTGLAVTADDNYADVIGDDGSAGDGYSHAINAVQVSRRLYNMPGIDKRGNRIGKDVYYDTMSETSSSTISAVLVALHFSRAYTQYDDADERNVYVCSSPDGVTGRVEATGAARPCKGCPEQVWRVNAKGKRSVNCNEVYTALAIDTQTNEPFFLKFKSTATPVIRTHLARHHTNRHRNAKTGRFENVPIWAYHVKLGLELSSNGNYAVPTIERGRMVTKDEKALCLNTAAALGEALARAAGDRDDGATAPAEAAGTVVTDDTSFDYGGNAS